MEDLGAHVLFPELPDLVDIQQALESYSDFQDTNASYYRQLAQDEIEDRRKKYLDNEERIQQLVSEMKAKKSFYEQQIKELDTINGKLFIEERTGQAYLTGQLLYGFKDEKTNTVFYYQPEGTLAYQRPMNASERQKTIHAQARDNMQQ